MPDEDIPLGWRGDQSFVVFSRNEHRGFLSLPQSEDIEREIHALPWDMEVECIIEGISAKAADLLRCQYRNAPREELRESLLHWLTTNGN